MEIFTEDAKKEIKRYLPHYIVGSGFLIVSLLIANYLTTLINSNITQPKNVQAAHQQEEFAPQQEDTGLLPSEIKIGLPYSEAIKDTSKPLIVEFYADWCPHSKRLTPVMAEVSEEISKVNFTSVDTQVDENYYLAKKYKVDKFPFLVIVNPKTGKYKEILLEESSFSKEGLTALINDAVRKFK